MEKMYIPPVCALCWAERGALTFAAFDDEESKVPICEDHWLALRSERLKAKGKVTLPGLISRVAECQVDGSENDLRELLASPSERSPAAIQKLINLRDLLQAELNKANHALAEAAAWPVAAAQ